MQYFPDSIFSVLPFHFLFFKFIMFIYFVFHKYMWIYVENVNVFHNTHVRVTWQPAGADSPLLSCGTLGMELRVSSFDSQYLYALGHRSHPLPPIQAVSVQAILEFIIFPCYGITSSFWLLLRWFGDGTKWCCPPGNGFWLEYYARGLLGTAGTVCSAWQGEQSRGKTLLSMVGLVHLHPFALVHWRYCHLTRKKNQFRRGR